MNGANMPHPSHPVQPRGVERIVFVRQRFSQFGGGELILDRTIAAMKGRGVRVALLGRSWTGGQDVEFIPCDPSRFPRFLRERKFAQAACRRLATEKDALVQSHERIPCCDIFRAGDGVHAAFIAHRARGMNAVAAAALSLHPFHRSVMALEREMFASPRLKAVIVNSEMVADEIVRHFAYPRERIHLVPNGIDLSRFHPDARARHRAEVRARLGTDMQRPVALFVGSGFKRKGLDAAIAALAKSQVGAELWVIGHDRRPAAYVTLAERSGIPVSRFRLLGPVPDPLPYYAAADLLVLPSIYDPFPSTVIEALACGLPAVTSTSSGAQTAAAALDPGLVCDAYDIASLAQATARGFTLSKDPTTAGRARAVANSYDLQAMVDRLLSIYGLIGLRGEKHAS
jgi:UDP-glucose:(heptosyl)LPS alpha-1,3-glucosyltransferase